MDGKIILRWMCFVICWLCILLLSRLATVWYSNIPQEIIESGFSTNGGLSLYAKSIAYGGTAYLLFYLLTWLLLFVFGRVSRKSTLFFAGTPFLLMALLFFVFWLR